MKNLMLVLFLMLSMGITSEIQAQACTPAQKAACKKICADKTACTPAQAAACQKVCNGKMASNTNTTSGTAVKVVNKSPEKKANCMKSCDKGKVVSTSGTPVKLVGLELLSTNNEKEGSKKVDCSKPCQKKMEE